jgi:flagellar hook protein FlgE
MAFTTALSGLNASANNLAVTGNNIANVNTTGFKKSRSEFADVYSNSLGGVSATTPGSGVKVANVAQQFAQGNIDFTDNSLDLAISGEGFFTLGQSVGNPASHLYTRAGTFHVDKDGNVVNNDGRPLLVQVADPVTKATVINPLNLSSSLGAPKATSFINMVANLDSRELQPVVGTFARDDPNSYNFATSTSIYDSLGNPHVVTSYFVKTATENQWEMHNFLDSSTTELGTPPYTLTFDTNGSLVSTGATAPPTGVSPPLTIPPPTGSGTIADPYIPAPYTVSVPPASDISLKIDLLNSTQYGSSSGVNSLSRDGNAAGQLAGIDVGKTGIVTARYTSGATKDMGQLLLGRFPNAQGLQKIGNTSWTETATSGLAVEGVPGANNFGSIQSGALEASNVDLANQLVNLIVAQQSYQANAQTITTENEVIRTLLQLR